LDKHTVWGRFEIMSPITPWIVQHEVQLLIKLNLKSIRNFKSLEYFVYAKKSDMLSIPRGWKLQETLINEAALKCAYYWHVNGMGIQLQAGIQLQNTKHIGAYRTNHNWEFCYRWD